MTQAQCQVHNIIKLNKLKMTYVGFFETKHILACNSINWVNFLIDNVNTEWLVDTGASLSAIKMIF